MKNDVISPEFDENGRPLRRIRSFVRRQGRLTKGQEHALENYWPVMGVEFSEDMLDFPALFGREAPVTLEIGFGMGASLVAMAKDRPEQDFLGIEVHSPGVGACLASAHEEGLSNLRVMCHDAVEVLHKMIPDNSLRMVQLFFPDPWHKARHNKRRIVQVPFAELGGRLFRQSLCGLYPWLQILLRLVYEAIYRAHRTVGDIPGCETLASNQKSAKIQRAARSHRFSDRWLSAPGGSVSEHPKAS